jgi:hypothetical protein
MSIFTTLYTVELEIVRWENQAASRTAISEAPLVIKHNLLLLLVY